MLQVISNEALTRQENETYEKELQARQNTPLILGIAGYIRACWESARDAKREIEEIMLDAMRQRNGEYDANKLSEIKKVGGSNVYMMITETKCRSAESWLRDVLLDTGSPPWDLSPTPIPDLPPESESAIEKQVSADVMKLMQDTGEAVSGEGMQSIKEIARQKYRMALSHEAKNRAMGMTRKISDQLAEGGWPESFDDFITDLVTFPCAFIKGPIVRKQRKLGWGKDEEGNTVIEPTDELGPEFERVSPFRIYPEPGISTIKEGYLFHHHKLTNSELADLIDVPGYDSDAIRSILDLGIRQSWVTPDTEYQKEVLERKPLSHYRMTEPHDVLEFWGRISGKMLVEWGMSAEEITDQSRHYDANVWLAGDYVIKVVLNYDPLGEKPYAKTSFIKVAGAFWGKAPPEIIKDVQAVCNAAARSLVNNMGISSGPQVEINIDRLPAGEEITQMYPWKEWQVLNDPLGSSAPAIRFMQPDSNATELVGVYDKFSKLADDHSGIPSYLSGDLDVQGAGRTASGLSMLMSAAGKGIRQVVMHIDSDIIKPIIRRQFVYNMRFGDDESIKGDVSVIPRGSINLAVREQSNIRALEFLNATANEFDMPIVGQEGRAALLREIAKGLQMNVEDIVPSKEQLEHRKALEETAAQQGGGGAGTPAAPAALAPDGSPKGGQEANTVTSRIPGQSQ